VCHPFDGEDETCAAGVPAHRWWNGMKFHSDYLGLNHEVHLMDKQCTQRIPDSSCSSKPSRVCSCEIEHFAHYMDEAKSELTETKVWSTLSTRSRSCEGELSQHLGVFKSVHKSQIHECFIRAALFTVVVSGEPKLLGPWIDNGFTNSLPKFFYENPAFFPWSNVSEDDVFNDFDLAVRYEHADNPDIILEYDHRGKQFLFKAKQSFFGLPTWTVLYKHPAELPDVDSESVKKNTKQYGWYLEVPEDGWVPVKGAEPPPVLMLHSSFITSRHDWASWKI